MPTDQSAAVHPPWSCRYCDRRVASRIQANGGCRPCRAVATSMCDLGLAIRRFVRRAEVAELCSIVGDFMSTPDHYWSAAEYAEVRDRAHEALDRLETLALEDR